MEGSGVDAVQVPEDTVKAKGIYPSLLKNPLDKPWKQLLFYIK
jgi:hypothetical protein